MSSKTKAECFEEQVNSINQSSQTNEIPDHYDIQLENGERYHLQRVDSELNRDAIIFTSALAALAGLNTVIYHKYTATSGDLYVCSEYFEEEKTWFSGEGLTNSYVIEEIRKQFSTKVPAKGEETFLKYCQMIILDLFSLNCDRTHNNWRQNGNDILVFDYNFTFGSAQLLHGLSNAQLIALSSTGIHDYPKGKNGFLNAVFERNQRLVMQDLADYTIHKSNADLAHTRTQADAAGVSLLGSFRGLIHYFKVENIATEWMEFYLNLSADRVFKSIPASSQITLEGNKLYLASLFEYTKSLVRTFYQSERRPCCMHDIEGILQQACHHLQGIPGVAGVVLGGSRATGTARADSDVDIGVYYHRDSLDLAALDAAAATLDQEHRVGLVAGPGGWGNWVDGGAWMVMDGLHVDLILRDVARVQQAIDDCSTGRVTAHYQPGHPHAFLNAMYMGELSACRLLWDPTGALAALQARTRPYPPKMKEAILGLYLFECGFSHMLAEKNTAIDDPYYVAAHVVRSISALNQALFALNEVYCLNEKKAVRRIGTFSIAPTEYPQKVNSIFALLGSDAGAACCLLGALVAEVRSLAAKD